MANPFCVPTLASLPGSPAADFDWWVNPPDPNLIRYYPDNPNWLGALSLSQGNGANRDKLFRVLKGNLGGQNYLLLQWVVRVSDLDPAIDRVNVLLGVPGGNYLAFNARLGTASSTSASPPGTQNAGFYIYRIHSCSVSGGVVSILDPAMNPPDTSSGDIENTGRMWVDVTSPTRRIGTKWAFQVAIPLGSNWGGAVPSQLNLPASGAFKLWFEVWSSAGGNGIPQQWPPTAPQTTGALQVIPTGITESQMLDLATGGVCDSAVTLSSMNIGTRAAPGGAPRPDNWTIKLDLGKPYPPLSAPYNVNHTPDLASPEHQNQFFAAPNASSLNNAQKLSLRSSFSLANWGSQYSDPSAASWRPIDRGNNVNFDTVTGECRVVWPMPGDEAGPNTFIVNFVRNINKYLNAWAANVPFPAGSQNPHQCMLVELSSTDPSVVITTSSVYTNMNVANASTFRRFAEISVVGAPPISIQPRDVYLYVQKFNMPPVVSKEDKPPATTFNLDQPRLFAAAAVSTGGPRENEVEEIAAFVPTYTVHGFIDTGKKWELEDGRKIPVLRPQTSFGYFVLHEGDLHGWETRLYGAEKLAENFYVVRVPNNGSVHVETAIQARETAQEPPLPPDGRLDDKTEVHHPRGCLAFLLGLFGHKKH